MLEVALHMRCCLPGARTAMAYNKGMHQDAMSNAVHCSLSSFCVQLCLLYQHLLCCQQQQQQQQQRHHSPPPRFLPHFLDQLRQLPQRGIRPCVYLHLTGGLGTTLGIRLKPAAGGEKRGSHSAHSALAPVSLMRRVAMYGTSNYSKHHMCLEYTVALKTSKRTLCCCTLQLLLLLPHCTAPVVSSHFWEHPQQQRAGLLPVYWLGGR
jgi:hypothetical protein